MKGKTLSLEKLKIDKTAVPLPFDIKEAQNKDIAIIGMAVRLPKAQSLKEFWSLMTKGVGLAGELPEKRRSDTEKYLKYKNNSSENAKYLKGAYLDEIDKFDYRFFKMTPKEASLMSPIQRLFLETSWKAVEDGGYGGGKLASTNTGVYLGFIGDAEGYKYKQMVETVEDPAILQMAMAGNLSSIIPGRISYTLDLKGPSMLVDTACSSSLVALHLACKAIRAGECDQALAGGIRLNILPFDDGIRIGMESSDGITRTFDDGSDGTGIGEGVIVLLLKPLSNAKRDNDNIYAIIKGTAANQDGISMGITAPNAVAQAMVIEKAWRDADIDPRTISYIEAHGTGTKLGDPIEIQGITKAFSRYTGRKQFCAIGSVKSNLGHLYEAAGLAGVVKSVLMLRNKKLVPSIHFKYPNRKITFEESPVYVSSKLQNWETQGEPRRCGVSSFGFSGTNCHVILEEFQGFVHGEHYENKPRIFTLSAKSKESLKALIGEYKAFCHDNTGMNMRDLCYTASTGRGHYNFRLAFVAYGEEDFKQKILHLQENELGQWTEEIFYGEKDAKATGEAGQAESRHEHEMRALVSSYVSASMNGGEKLKEICSLYVKGVDVSWELLYSRENAHRMSLPTYAFEGTRCWLKIPEVQDDAGAGENLFYGIRWEKEDGTSDGYGDMGDGEVLIFRGSASSGKDMGDTFRKHGTTAIEVEYGSKYEKHGEHSYSIANTREQHEALLKEVKQRVIGRIIFMPTVGQACETGGIHELDRNIDRGVIGLLHLAKAMHDAGMAQKVKLAIVSELAYEIEGREKKICPENGAMLGLARVMAREYPHMECKCIDIDELTTQEKVLQEIHHKDSYNTAYRNGQRYVQKFGITALDGAKSLDIALKDKGVYIVTGGAGGIGLEIAKHMAAKTKVNMAFINRTPIPPASSWDAVLKENTDGKISGIINALKDVEGLGGKVVYCQADIGNMEEIEEVAQGLRKEFGSINGIIHCAGVADYGDIANQEEKAFREILHPKIRGSWALHKATENDNMDFFILFSSVASIFSAPGQGAYSAANSYEDSFAAYRNRLGKRTMAINSVAWKETGMAVRHSANMDTIFKAITNRKAVEAFDRVLDKELSQVLIGELNFDDSKIELIHKYPFKLSAELEQQLKASKLKMEGRRASLKGKKAASKTEAGSGTEGAAEVKELVENICKDILGFEDIDCHESFFDMGADSITLSRIHEKIDREFPGTITISQMFANPNVDRISAYISGQRPGREQEKVQRDKTQMKGEKVEDLLDQLLEQLENGDMDIEQALKSVEKL